MKEEERERGMSCQLATIITTNKSQKHFKRANCTGCSHFVELVKSTESSAFFYSGESLAQDDFKSRIQQLHPQKTAPSSFARCRHRLIILATNSVLVLN